MKAARRRGKLSTRLARSASGGCFKLGLPVGLCRRTRSLRTCHTFSMTLRSGLLGGCPTSGTPASASRTARDVTCTWGHHRGSSAKAFRCPCGLGQMGQEVLCYDTAQCLCGQVLVVAMDGADTTPATDTPHVHARRMLHLRHHNDFSRQAPDTLRGPPQEEILLTVEGSATPAHAGVCPGRSEAFLFALLIEQRFALW